LEGFTALCWVFSCGTLDLHGPDPIRTRLWADSLCNSSKAYLDRIRLIRGRQPRFYLVDVTDETALGEDLAAHSEIDSVVHFVTLKVNQHGYRNLLSLLYQLVIFKCKQWVNLPRFPLNFTASMLVVLSFQMINAFSHVLQIGLELWSTD
jgi:hypothetical protein